MALAFDPQRYGEALRAQLRKSQHSWSSTHIDKYVKDTVDKMVADSDERDRKALLKLNSPPTHVRVSDPALFTETTVKVIKLLQSRFPEADYQTCHDTARVLVSRAIGWPTASLIGWSERTVGVIKAEAEKQKAAKAAAKPTRQPSRRLMSALEEYDEPYIVKRQRSR